MAMIETVVEFQAGGKRKHKQYHNLVALACLKTKYDARGVRLPVETVLAPRL